MNTLEKRETLAEAMGWKHITLASFGGNESNVWESPGGTQAADSLPNPYINANHDYNVLEWMRNGGSRKCYGDIFGRFAKLLKHACWYEKGDYADATIMVIT